MKETGLYLELKTAALDVDPKKAVRKAVEVASIIGISVHVKINSVLVCAYPEDDAELLASEWELRCSTDLRAAFLPKRTAQ
jgi:hypothetical protein